jgi:hypothetical protein
MTHSTPSISCGCRFWNILRILRICWSIPLWLGACSCLKWTLQQLSHPIRRWRQFTCIAWCCRRFCGWAIPRDPPISTQITATSCFSIHDACCCAAAARLNGLRKARPRSWGSIGSLKRAIGTIFCPSTKFIGFRVWKWAWLWQWWWFDRKSVIL